MARFFNTTGPCNPEDHYMLDPAARLVGADLVRYVENKLYWVLHAPRQTGKTTFLQSWMREINAAGKAVACYVSVERCQGLLQPEQSMPAICDAIEDWAGRLLEPAYIPKRPSGEPSSLLEGSLGEWARIVSPKPLVVLFDEVDVLRDQSMASFLRQLRGGFAGRGIGKFPVSIALVGMRDLRDYLIRSKDGAPVNPGSPFNVKEDSVSLSSFTKANVNALAALHSQETGQAFEAAALDLLWDFTRGQPWLTNALLKKCVWTLCPKGETVTEAEVRQAREILIEARAVHLDSLAERLRDPRIQRIVETILVGESRPEMTRGDDFTLALDLGLVTLEGGSPQIANPIYREVIARVLSQEYQYSIAAPEFAWQKFDGTLDMDALLFEFQAFWRRNSDVWEGNADYVEAFPHLLLMAFLQRVVNGGGRIEREYAAGRGRVDLAVQFSGAWSIIEIKLVRPGDGRESTVTEGLEQVERYRQLIDPRAPAYLVVFDRTPAGRALPWAELLTWEDMASTKGRVTVVGG
ncbi:MAG: PD-(D/E)XK nuclease domain-containing protein [Rectinemataceae bacterium]